MQRRNIFLACLILALLLSGCGSGLRAAPYVRIGWNGEPDTLNPGMAQLNESFSIFSLIYDTLYVLNLDGSYSLSLAESVDVSEIIEERTREVAELILSYAHSLWGRGERLNRLILAGGGANIFRSYFTGYPNLNVPEEPSLSNVRGYLKLARKTRW